LTIFLVEQNAHAALSVARRGYVIENGKIVLEGRSDDLIENEDVREFYLGGAKGQRRFLEAKRYKRRKRWL